MSTQIGIGFSQELSVSTAARSAAFQVKTLMKQQPVDLAVVFCSDHYNALESLHIVRQHLPSAKIIGCSTAGIVLASSIEMRGITVLAISSDEIQFNISHQSDLTSANMRVTGAELARLAASDNRHDRRGIFLVLSDSLPNNYAFMLKGIQEVFGKFFPIICAESIADSPHKKPYQFFQEKILTHSAVAVLITGTPQIGLAIRHGWKPLGKPRFITKAEGNIIKTIDHKRASSIYEEYFESSLEDLQSQALLSSMPLYPLGIYLEGEREYLLRTVTGFQPDGSIICHGDVAENNEVHMMIGNKDFCKQAVLNCALEVQETLGDKKPRLILVFESLSRYKLLGKEAVQEAKIIQEVLGASSPLIGIYTQGELASLKSVNHTSEPVLQNGTMMILAIA